MRSKIVLACTQGRSNVEVAADLRIHVSEVGKWRRRFLAERLEGCRMSSVQAGHRRSCWIRSKT
ncbi:helix-turn-helix domain-containing protein [Streptosporangium vulgare]|uniref:Helix-turn-helix domain-containing protein n=1 Tax=Streptosporangium vulgare TaxID=46190 RepID=A0ABV5TS17_9ACTN